MGNMNQMTPEVAQLLHLPMGQVNNMQQLQMQQQMQQMMAMQGMDQAMFMQMQQMQNMQNQAQGGGQIDGNGQPHGEQEEGSIPQEIEAVVSLHRYVYADFHSLLRDHEGHLRVAEAPPSVVAFPLARASLLREDLRTGSETKTASLTPLPALLITERRAVLYRIAARPVIPGHPRRTRGMSAASGAGVLRGQGTDRGSVSGTETGNVIGRGNGTATASVNAIETATVTVDHRGETVMLTARKASTRATTTSALPGERGAEVSKKSDRGEALGLDVSDREQECISSVPLTVFAACRSIPVSCGNPIWRFLQM